MPDTIYEAWAAGAGFGATFEGSSIATRNLRNQDGREAGLAATVAAQEETIRKYIRDIDRLNRLRPEPEIQRQLEQALLTLSERMVECQRLARREKYLAALSDDLRAKNKQLRAQNRCLEVEVEQLRRRLLSTGTKSKRP